MSKPIQISDEAREAAKTILFRFSSPVQEQAAHYIQLAINSATEKAIDTFIDNLITTLESHGIDATNWDGDDAPHIIVSGGIVAAISEATEKLKKELNDQLEHAATQYQLGIEKLMELHNERVKELEKDKAYLTWRLQSAIPLLQEARDALPAISKTLARLHNVRLDLADRMDEAGTATREQFDAATSSASPSSVSHTQDSPAAADCSKA